MTVLLVILGWVVYRANRPRLYRPDEGIEEITSGLSRGLPPDAPVPRWRDVTVQAGLGGFRNFAGERTSQIPEDMGSGAAWGDFDNDGEDDLFITHWVAQEHALYDNLFADFNTGSTAAPRSAPALGNAPASAPRGAATMGTNYGLRFMDINEMKGLGQIALPYVGWGT